MMFDEIPISAIELPEGRFQTFPDKSLPGKLTLNFLVEKVAVYAMFNSELMNFMV